MDTVRITAHGETVTVERGIKGIRKFLANATQKTSGWHVFFNDAYSHFVDADGETAFQMIERLTNSGKWVFTGPTGNGLYFTSVSN